MAKRIYALILLFALLWIVSVPASATVFQAVPDESHMNIVYFTGLSELEKEKDRVDTIVLTEDQMIQLGSNIKDIFLHAQMVFVLTSKSVSAIQEICGLASGIHSDDENPNKYATIIEQNCNGEYTFNNISAFICETGSNEILASSNISAQSVISISSLVEDGLDAYAKTKENQISMNARMHPSNFYSYATDSAVLYGLFGSRIGTMGYTAYWYKITKLGNNRIFDVICVATFAPDSNNSCKKMSVYLGTPFDNHEILEAANIISTNQTYTHNLMFSIGTEEISGSYENSWSYTVGAQTVTKSFDMTTNDRTWIFEPINANNGDAWIEEPGLRMSSSQFRCHTTVSISYPFTMLGIVINNNSISTNWFFEWN